MLEDHLRDAYDAIIVPFWRAKGKSISFVSRDGLNIRGMTFLQSRPETAIVISSGRTESFIKYKELVYDLYHQGCSVFIADHRGQGLSDRVLADQNKTQMGHVGAFQDYVTDLKQFYTEYVRPTEHRKHVLIGHSMGGCIASLYLETHNDDFNAAVLCSPMDELALGFFPDLSRAIIDFDELIGRGEEYAPKQHGYDEGETFSDKCLTHSELRWNLMRREYRDNPAAKLGGPSVLWVKLAQGAAKTGRENSPHIKVRVLLLQATDDTIVRPAGQLEFCDRINDTHPGFCRLERIVGARHEILVESDLYRQPALELVLDFIRNQVPSSG
jgi:lysophospholipase